MRTGLAFVGLGRGGGWGAYWVLVDEGRVYGFGGKESGGLRE